MGILKSLYERIVKYNTRRKILNILGNIKEFSREQCEKAADIILMVRKTGSRLESIVRKECPDKNIIEKLEKNFYLIKNKDEYLLGRYIDEQLSRYRKGVNIAYAPFLRSF